MGYIELSGTYNPYYEICRELTLILVRHAKDVKTPLNTEIPTPSYTGILAGVNSTKFAVSLLTKVHWSQIKAPVQFP